MDCASCDEASYKKRLPIMQPINLSWILPSKLSEKIGALEMVDATKTHARARAISSECRSNGHKWNAAIFTRVGNCPMAPLARTHFLTQSATRRARRRDIATRRFRHFKEHSVKDWEKGTTLEFLSVIPGPGGTKGAYFTSTRTRRYQDGPNP